MIKPIPGSSTTKSAGVPPAPPLPRSLFPPLAYRFIGRRPPRTSSPSVENAAAAAVVVVVVVVVVVAAAAAAAAVVAA